MKRRRRNVFWIILLLIAAVLMGAIAGYVFDSLTSERDPIKEPEVIEQKIAIGVVVEQDEPVSGDEYDEEIVYYDEDSSENQERLKKLIERKKQKTRINSIDLSVYQVTPRIMDKNELIPVQDAPKKGTISPGEARVQSKLPGGFEPPERISIPIESIDLRKVLWN